MWSVGTVETRIMIITKYQFGLVDQRPGHSDPTLLTTTQMPRRLASLG